MRRSLWAERAAIGSLAVRVAGVALGSLVTIFIARSLGAEASGIYALVTQTGMTLSLLAVGGLDISLVRFLSPAASNALHVPTALMKSILLHAIRNSSVALLVCAILYAITVKAGMIAPVEIVFLLSVAMVAASRSFTRLSSAVLRSFAKHKTGQLIEVVAIPGLVLIAMCAIYPWSIDYVVAATVISGCIVAIAGCVLAIRSRPIGLQTLPLELSTVVSASRPLWGVAVLLGLTEWYALAVVSMTLSVSDAGIYRVALLFASVFAIISSGLYSAFTPRFSSAYHNGKLAELAGLAKRATALATVIVVPAAIAMVSAATAFADLLGPGFGAAPGVIVILVVGQAIYTIFGPAALILAMAGFEKTNLRITIASTVVLAVGVPLAALADGIHGVALIVSVILIGRNFIYLIAVWRHVGVNPVTGTLRV